MFLQCYNIDIRNKSYYTNAFRLMKVKFYFVGEKLVGLNIRECISLINGTVYATHSSHPGDLHALSRVSIRAWRFL